MVLSSILRKKVSLCLWYLRLTETVFSFPSQVLLYHKTAIVIYFYKSICVRQRNMFIGEKRQSFSIDFMFLMPLKYVFWLHSSSLLNNRNREIYLIYPVWSVTWCSFLVVTLAINWATGLAWVRLVLKLIQIE